MQVSPNNGTEESVDNKTTTKQARFAANTEILFHCATSWDQATC